MSFSQITTLTASGLDMTSDLARVISARSNILEMTQDAEDAVLRPSDYGAFPHDLRAALAARIARRSNDEKLAVHYEVAAGDYAALARPEVSGEEQGLTTVLSIVDLVANAPKDISADHIAALQSAGISDPDIVRLCELVAFMAYQIRVVSGLRLMQGETA
ncbi:hypothetical protein [Celeribacter litoreus]|uniref:hypothetical protein n=1 Tax=Celeribacter litoreus TaxID=2876714 RepID=UPI001CCE0D5F|nr:hypothetical protein [Celeribacter litoreus]MCA0044763.1 hypothetical protein [Celeribacter litoreus]